ncbi:hypothetical protein R3P38DRAFT_2805222 [Favolaschia claudopus]|uniref:Uncharacterized protein n=1 Tax=Favolaschia claudopus TaxID=2862362 RepID=A0AAV9ZP80_9AGAR
MSTDPDWQCTTHSACIATWKRLWWDKIGRQLLCPERALKTKDIQAEVEKLTHKDLHEGCRLDMVRKIQYEVEFSDQRLIQGVVEAVVRTTQVFEISWVMYIYSRQDEKQVTLCPVIMLKAEFHLCGWNLGHTGTLTSD